MIAVIAVVTMVAVAGVAIVAQCRSMHRRDQQGADDKQHDHAQ
jgi:hypothetical protein